MTLKHGHCIGKKPTPEYRAWQSMIQRCTNPKNAKWEYYGGRGIEACDEWLNDFEAFIAHVGRKPSPELSLDRLDNEGHYEPGNVAWSTRKKQILNSRLPAARPRKAR